MARFGGNKNKEVPAITSSSLSDIVFMLLFFFMVTTQLRETENKVIVKLPEATEVVKLERNLIVLDYAAECEKNLLEVHLEMRPTLKVVVDQILSSLHDFFRLYLF